MTPNLKPDNPAPERPSDDSAVVECRAVTVFYQRLCAVRDVTLTVPRHRITAIVGPSGCGKSSFLAALNRMTDLIAGCRVEGQVLLEGQDIHRPDQDLIRLRRRVGMIFQQPNPFPMSIRRNLDLPMREMGLKDPAQRAQRIERALNDVGLWHEVADRLDRSALALSGGQQQRLCIARALVLDPEVLLFDEPCSALDPISSAVVEDLILGLKARTSIVIVTHNLSQARRMADNVAMFWHHEGNGCLLESGPAHQVFEAPSHPVTAEYFAGSRG